MNLFGQKPKGENTFTRGQMYCFTDDGFIKSIEDQQIRLRKTTQFHAGEKPQHRLGQGYNFLGYKEYEFGDDLRHLDVHKLAICQKRLIKQYEVSSAEPLVILVDDSSSMYHDAFKAAPHKAQFAVNLGCILSLVAALSGDSSYLGIFPPRKEPGDQPGQGLPGEWSPKVTRPVVYHEGLRVFMERHLLHRKWKEILGRPSLPASYREALRASIPKYHLFIISDLWSDLDEHLAPALLELKQIFRKLYVFQVLGQVESDPSLLTSVRRVAVSDSERADEHRVVRLDPERFKRRIFEHRTRTEAFAADLGVYLEVLSVPEDEKDQRTLILKTLRNLKLAY